MFGTKKVRDQLLMFREVKALGLSKLKTIPAFGGAAHYMMERAMAPLLYTQMVFALTASD